MQQTQEALKRNSRKSDIALYGHGRREGIVGDDGGDEKKRGANKERSTMAAEGRGRGGLDGWLLEGCGRRGVGVEDRRRSVRTRRKSYSSGTTAAAAE